MLTTKENTILGLDLFKDDFINSLIFHIPHSKTEIPNEFKYDFLSAELVANEINLLTDFHTDEIFSIPNTSNLVFPYSRVFCDVERLPDDEEVMFEVGRGIYYTNTDDGQLLRYNSNGSKGKIYEDFYLTHHDNLSNLVDEKIYRQGVAIIIDCHSFSDIPFKTDIEQDTNRPDFCLGTDIYHTPKWLIDLIRNRLIESGYSVSINYPYEGTIVPTKYYNTNDSVYSIMIEINRKLYMDGNVVNMDKVNLFNSIMTKIFS